MSQPKAVIRPTGLVQIPIRAPMNYGFNSDLYPPISRDQSSLPLPQSQKTYSTELHQDPQQCFTDGSYPPQQQAPQQPLYLPLNIEPKTEVLEPRQVLQSQVVIIQSSRQPQYPVQPQPPVNYKNQVPRVPQPQVAIPRQQPPPMIVQPGGEILNPTLRQVLGHKPSSVKCPQCYNQVMTRVEYEPNQTTHCLAFILFICLCWCCCCIPYCVNGTRNAQHYCPVCGVYLGLHEVELC